MAPASDLKAFQQAVAFLAEDSLAMHVAGVGHLRNVIVQSRDVNTALMISSFLTTWLEMRDPTDSGLRKNIDDLQRELRSVMEEPVQRHSADFPDGARRLGSSIPTPELPAASARQSGWWQRLRHGRNQGR